METTTDPRFCQMCGTALEMRAVFGRERPACPSCGHVHFDDPKVAVGVVAERDGAILLTRRAHEPGMGLWSFPSGFVDAYEDVRRAAAREALEETGLAVTVGPLLGVYQNPGSRVVFLAFAGSAGPGEPVANEESHEVAFFPAGELPPLAFPVDPTIMDDWWALTGRAGS